MTHFGFNKFTLKKAPEKNSSTDIENEFSKRYKNPESTFRADIKYLLGKGHTYEEIADQLGRTKDAVKSQVKRMGLQQRKG